MTPRDTFDRAQELRHLANESELVRANAVLDCTEPVLIAISRMWTTPAESAEMCDIILDLIRDLSPPAAIDY